MAEDTLAPFSEVVDTNKDITLEFSAGRCIHNRACVLGRPDVFVPNVKGEWLHPERASADDIREIAHNCPSGAIAYKMKNGEPDETPPMVNTLRLRENGPYAVHAEIHMSSHEGVETRLTLCRCGASARKPYCDGSHTAAGFTASGEREPVGDKVLEHRNGPLAVEPQPDGPLKLSGALEIITGTGHTISRVEKAYLCRCGHSANKPFCDGSHKRVGFVAP